jgi:hypothetical protein
MDQAMNYCRPSWVRERCCNSFLAQIAANIANADHRARVGGEHQERSASVDWMHREAARARMRVLVKRLLG